MTKNEIRRMIKYQKKLLTFEEIHCKSQYICQKLLSLRAYKEATTLFTYVHFNQEVKTHQLIDQAWKDQKKVAVPKIIDRQMNFYYINSWQDLKEGYFSILEPINETIALPDKKTLMIMPGLAFDLKKHRIGYGGGYYDTYLSNYQSLQKIAFAFDFQVLPSIPSEPYDIKVDTILTEKREI